MTKLHPLTEYLSALSAPADLSTLSRMLGELDITRGDLGSAVRFDDEQYARNKISETEWYEMVCLCWKPGQGTPIHNHRHSSCAFLIVEGIADECLFSLDADGKLSGECKSSKLERGSIGASWDSDIHEMGNQTAEDLISLHIYSPPLRQMMVYSRQTGEGELWTPHRHESAVV